MTHPNRQVTSLSPPVPMSCAGVEAAVLLHYETFGELGLFALVTGVNAWGDFKTLEANIESEQKFDPIEVEAISTMPDNAWMLVGERGVVIGCWAEYE